jgi:hypothetical protein
VFSRRGGGGPSRREEFQQAWANPPRHTRWQVVRGQRLELRDSSEAVIAWTKPDRTLSSLKDPAGRMLVSFKPAVVKQVFSARNIVQLGIEGAVFGDVDALPGRGSQVSGPGLDLQDVSLMLTFAQIDLSGSHGPQVVLLPAGRLNDRFIDRVFSPADVSRIRQRSPLLYLPSPTGADQLSDPSGRVVARADYGPAGPGQDRTAPQSVEVGDNELPAAWLFAILLGCRNWHR